MECIVARGEVPRMEMRRWTIVGGAITGLPSIRWRLTDLHLVGERATIEICLRWTSSTRIPLAKDKHGVYRVGGTRVTLDSVVHAFQRGATAEEIVQMFPSLQLPDIYQVIGYYLKHRAELEEYFENRGREAK